MQTINFVDLDEQQEKCEGEISRKLNFSAILNDMFLLVFLFIIHCFIVCD